MLHHVLRKIGVSPVKWLCVCVWGISKNTWQFCSKLCIRRNIHPLTPIVVLNHLLSAFSIYNDPWHPPCSIYMHDTISVQVFFGLPFGLAPSTSYSIHFFRYSEYGMLDLPTATAIASALISSQLNYANSILFGSPSRNVAHLQRTQNAAARVVTQKPSHLSSINTLRELHWLPVQWHIKFKFASLTFKVMDTGTPL